MGGAEEVLFYHISLHPYSRTVFLCVFQFSMQKKFVRSREIWHFFHDQQQQKQHYVVRRYFQRIVIFVLIFSSLIYRNQWDNDAMNMFDYKL